MKRRAILLAFSMVTLVPAATAFAQGESSGKSPGGQSSQDQGPQKGKAHTPTPTAKPTPNPNAPKTIACPTTQFWTTVGGKQLWDTRVIKAEDAKATQRHRAAGTGSDVLWCHYEKSSSIAGVASKVFVVKQAPSSHPICTVVSDAMSFTCRALKAGENY